MFQTHHCEFYCEGLCGDGHVRAPRQMLVGGGAVWITSWVISDCCHCRISALLFEFVCPLALAKANSTAESASVFGVKYPPTISKPSSKANSRDVAH